MLSAVFVDQVGNPSAAVRAVAAAVGLAATAVALALLAQNEGSALGIALLLALALGGTNFAAGVLRWRGASARRLRIVGWAAMMCALLVPTTLSLALPLVALLALTLRTDRPLR
jgi:hypothetical protein